MATPIMLDVRGLEPPEPMERVLGALSTLGPGEQLLMIIDRQPRPLYRILQNNGYAYRETFKPEGIFEILIWQARRPHDERKFKSVDAKVAEEEQERTQRKPEEE